MGRPRIPLETRFWYFVTPGEPDKCWEWAGPKNKKGYGTINAGGRGGKTLLAHRVSFAVHNKPLCSDELVCHKCDNPPCINPAHLFAGTHSDNLKDMYKKGRGNRSWVKGNAHGKSKLTEDQALNIICDIRSQYVIAKIYGVSQPQISDIKKGKKWRHLWGL